MIKFSIKHLLTRKAKFIMTSIAILVATLIILFTYNVARQVNDGIISTASYYDIVVGANGSSTDLVMTTMFFTGTSTETVEKELYSKLKSNENVKEIVPFATGDNYRGNQIVGTEAIFLKDKKLKEGKYFEEIFDIVIGYDIAKEHSLKIGDKIIGSHGVSETSHIHNENPYIIVRNIRKNIFSL